MTSVAVIVLDTLRYDTFSNYFEWLDGLRFTNAWSTSHWTGPAHASLLTGRYPTEIGTTVKSRSLTCNSPVITELLQKKGYNTRLISTNLQIFVWDGWDRGFDERFGPNYGKVNPSPEGVVEWQKINNKLPLGGVSKYALAAVYCFLPRYKTIRSLQEGYHLAFGYKSSLAAVSNRINKQNFETKEFLLANIMDMHAPYYPPSNYRSVDRKIMPELEDSFINTVESPEEIRETYDDCGQYLSDNYRDLHSKLLSEFDYVITLSDHGEHLGEDGLWTHSYGLRPELTHVPINISGEDIESKIIDKPVNLLDVHATISDLTGVDTVSQGKSLLKEDFGGERLVEYHGLSERRREKFSDRDLGQLYEKYDTPLDGIISSEGYAFETHDNDIQVQGAWSPDEAQERLNTLKNSIERKPIRSDNTDTSDSIKQQLEALGYA